MSSVVSERSVGWERLADLLDQVESRGLPSLSADELRELSSLYRTTSGDLSLARARGRKDVALHLNQLLGRAHGVVYSRPPARKVELGKFFGVVMPRTFRRCWRYWLAALLIMVGFSLLGFVATRQNPGWADVLVSPHLREMIDPFLKSGHAAGTYFQETAQELGNAGLSSYVMVNNIKVALLCFATGIIFCLGTLFLLCFNSLMVGAVLGLGAHYGKMLLIVSVIGPHGVVELSAITIASAAGLRLGYAWVDPGDLLRRDALVIAAREAAQLVLGTIPMFIVAGTIEGMLSPQSTGIFASNAVRLGIGLASGAALYLWLFFGDYAFARRYEKKSPGNAVKNEQLQAT